MTGCDRDILISRIIDGEASPEDWTAFKSLADRDGSVWHDLATAQQDQFELEGGLAVAYEIADAVEAPVEQMVRESFQGRLRLVGSYGGWAVAAMLVLAATTGNFRGGPSNRADVLGPLTPEDAYQKYVEAGQRDGTVVGELPERIVLDSRPNVTGSGYEVIYIKQIVEKAIVPGRLEIGTNEVGSPVPLYKVRKGLGTW
ncbi:MAG: hypothetical protein KDA28_17155 [Phycisphaerales bacterium]|nr:hypothetical protein [Phycisphaerales bacterium]